MSLQIRPFTFSSNTLVFFTLVELSWAGSDLSSFGNWRVSQDQNGGDSDDKNDNNSKESDKVKTDSSQNVDQPSKNTQQAPTTVANTQSQQAVQSPKTMASLVTVSGSPDSSPASQVANALNKAVEAQPNKYDPSTDTRSFNQWGFTGTHSVWIEVGTDSPMSTGTAIGKNSQSGATTDTTMRTSSMSNSKTQSSTAATTTKTSGGQRSSGSVIIDHDLNWKKSILIGGLLGVSLLLNGL